MLGRIGIFNVPLYVDFVFSKFFALVNAVALFNPHICDCVCEDATLVTVFEVTVAGINFLEAFFVLFNW